MIDDDPCDKLKLSATQKRALRDGGVLTIGQLRDRLERKDFTGLPRARWGPDTQVQFWNAIHAYEKQKGSDQAIGLAQNVNVNVSPIFNNNQILDHTPVVKPLSLKKIGGRRHPVVMAAWITGLLGLVGVIIPALATYLVDGQSPEDKRANHPTQHVKSPILIGGKAPSTEVSEPGQFTLNVGQSLEINYTFAFFPESMPEELSIVFDPPDTKVVSTEGVQEKSKWVNGKQVIGVGERFALIQAVNSGQATVRFIVDGDVYIYRVIVLPAEDGKLSRSIFDMVAI